LGKNVTELKAKEFTEQSRIKIVILTMAENDKDLYEGIERGACGYLLKAKETQKFLALLSESRREEVPLSPALAKRILKEFRRQGRLSGSAKKLEERDETLTPRQNEILTLVAQGLTYREIGAKLFLSQHTIKYHMGEIIERLHLKNRRQVIEYAKRILSSI